MEFRIIKSPSAGAMNILLRRIGSGKSSITEPFDAVGLIQGKMIDMVVAADIAEKSVGVVVEDVKGSCPQNMILLAIMGDTASVESAMAEIKFKLKEGCNAC
ncbi:BMC domain protein [Halodesulfovibrio spirochaetisodalis]|uniref:BMC domain protein n=1 Tax=Halodesulfovibrio spirochaetisodalis TaxID=1560234 RepID=A0A1B7XB63_9BACT|nr:BMC domain protein [Halodesulfovibrio spirochaetisodalis]OBQ46618.1 BMC domain protein [Halodesulfovibrio spirochaetisodalis]